MWNEANFAVTWTGTPEQLVNLQQAAYVVIKNNDPQAQLISANIDAMCGLPYLEKLLSLGYANSADIIGYHFYVSPNRPEAIAILASQVTSLLSHYGANKPLWNTETGWLPPSRFTSDDQAAAVVVRAMLVGHSSGIGRFVWYEWDNHCCVTLFMTETDNATPTRAALARGQHFRFLFTEWGQNLVVRLAVCGWPPRCHPLEHRWTNNNRRKAELDTCPRRGHVRERVGSTGHASACR
jgi:hypothetical protein